MTTKDLYKDAKYFKDRKTLEKSLGVETAWNDVPKLIKAIREVGNDLVRPKDATSKEIVNAKIDACRKDLIADRCKTLGLPIIPTLVPKTLDEVKKFCDDNGTVIVKPSKGSDSRGFKEYHYRPIEKTELLGEIELDLQFYKNQNADNVDRQAVLQKFFPLDGKDSYHYSFKGWVDNDATFYLSHSYREEWKVDPNYDSAFYNKLTRQCVSNALNVSATTFDIDKKIDDEAVRQTSALCKDGLDSCFMHGDAIVNNGKVYIIDLSPINNFATLISFALENKTKFLTFPIIMPEDGDRQKQIDLVSDHNGYYVFSEFIDPTNKRFLYFLFTGKSVKEIHANREAYTKAIFS